MTRMVQCVVLKTEAEGLDKPPHPGELGVRIYENVSKEGWQQWLERLTTIINENGNNICFAVFFALIWSLRGIR